MSNARPQQKPNFLVTLLWSMGLFILLQMYCNKPQTPVTPQSIDQLYATLKSDNARGLDQSIVNAASDYRNAVDTLAKQGKLTPAEADAKRIDAAILTADTQLVDGIARNETSKVRNAFYTLAPFQRKLLNQPEWNKPYPVYDLSKDKRFGWSEWSGQQLYERVRSELAARNQHELVWGFIPGYQIIDGLVNLTGAMPGFSYAFAAFLLAFIVRSIVFPLSQRQIMYGRQMSQLAPLLREIKEKYKDDQLTANQKVMELYKEYGLNPMAGCAPLAVQMPFFFAIYQCMLRYQFTFEKGTFLWINPHASTSSHGFFAANLGQMDMVLTIIYGISMIVSTLLMPVTDPTQVKQQRLMGVGMAVVMTFFMFTGAVPVVSGFVLYWTFTNMLATAQSLRAYRLPLPPLVKVNAAGGGVYPTRGGGKWAKWLEEMQRQAIEQQQAPQPKKSSSPFTGTSNGEPSTNGKVNGKPAGSTFLGTGETKTGTPAKHKPKNESSFFVGPPAAGMSRVGGERGKTSKVQTLMQTVELTAKTVQDATQQAADKLGVPSDQVKVTILEEVKGLFGKSTVRVRGEVVESAVPETAPAKPARGKRTAPAKSEEPVAAVPVEEPAAATPEPAKEDGAPKGGRGRGRKAPTEAPAVAEATAAPETDAPLEEVVAGTADAETLLAIVRDLLGSAQLAVSAELGSISGRYVNIVLDGRDVSFIVGKHGDVLNAMQYLVNIIASRRIERGVRATLDGNDYRRRREEALTTLAQRIADQVRVRGEEAVLDALPAFERRIVHKALGEMEGVTTYSEGEEPNRRVVIAPVE